jgi:hypothetical protein
MSAVIVLVVVFIIGVITLTAENPQATPKPTKASEPMRDMAVGTDDEYEIAVGADTEKKLEQLLSGRRVEIPVKRARSASVPEGSGNVDRI